MVILSSCLFGSRCRIQAEQKADVYLNVVSLLSAYAQPKYILSLPNGLSVSCGARDVAVDSNDSLYGGTPKFVAELNSMSQSAVAKVGPFEEPINDVKVLECIEELKTGSQGRENEVAMKLFERFEGCKFGLE